LKTAVRTPKVASIKLPPLGLGEPSLLTLAMYTISTVAVPPNRSELVVRLSQMFYVLLSGTHHPS
jgi:hypothetical protein